MILVTGAGGHLGANMVRRLLADGLPVRAMLHTARDRPSVEGLPVEVVVGDLRDAAFAAASARGCRQIYHCAAKVSTTYRNKDDIFAANVLGTRNILNAARSAAVEKVVVTGSFSAVGIRSDRPSNEDDPSIRWNRICRTDLRRLPSSTNVSRHLPKACRSSLRCRPRSLALMISSRHAWGRF